MNPPIKKLSVLFLIGAILTSSLALSVSAIINRNSTEKNIAQQGIVIDESGNYKIYGAGPNGQNLTEEVSDIFARQLVEANPEGPKQNEDGSVELFAPNNTELLSYLSTNTPSEDILKPAIDDSRIQIIQNFDTSDIAHYFSEITQIQDNITSNPIWQMGLSTTTIEAAASMNWTAETGKIFIAAQDEAYAIKVPAPLVPLHKSELAFFSTIISFSNVVAQDPVAAVALSKNLDRIIMGQGADIEQAVKDIQKNFPDLLSALPQNDRPVLAEIFGVRVAHAIVLNFDAANFGQWIMRFWQDYKQIIISTALGTLKNFLMQKIGQKIIGWAQGAGAPGYVTNWAMLEINAAFDAKFGLISKESAKACGNAATAGLYGDILASALGVPTYAVGVGGVMQTVNEDPDCPPVSSGLYGVGGYSPENFLQLLTYNTYNDILRLKNQSIMAAGAASQAAVNEALSGRGSLDVKKCDDGSAVDNTGFCSDGNYAQTLTPGSAKQELITKALTGAQDIIAGVNNENTYGAIVQVLTNAVVTYALQEGEGIFSNSSSRPAGSPPQPPQPPATNNTVTQKLAWYSDELDTALTLAQGAVMNSNDAKTSFQNFLQYSPCADAQSGAALDGIRILEESLVVLNTRLQEIQSLIDTVNGLKQQQPPATQAQLDATGYPETFRTRSQGDYDASMTVLETANRLFIDCGS